MSKMRNAERVPGESEEQQILFQWAQMRRVMYPELELLFHIPNGGSRGKAEAGRFKAEGVKSGVPDICLPAARGNKHGLFIELKRTEGGKVSDEQKKWIGRLRDQGYEAMVCHGWKAAAQAIEMYLKGENIF